MSSKPAAARLLILDPERSDKLAAEARSRGFDPVPVTELPTVAQIADARNLLITPEHFAQLPLMDLGEEDVRIWISGTDGANPWTKPLPAWGAFVKRGLDIAVSLAFLIVMAPLLIAVAIGVKLGSPGPVFHVQTRLGADGRWFQMYKFRTMRTDNDASQHAKYFEDFAQGDVEQVDGLYKIVGDPRVTRIGQFLRKYSIDEVPQFINVVRGEMTVVGPRPMLPSEMRVLDARSWQRLRVKPGITGLWQVSGRSRTTFETMIDLDLAYWQSWSLRRELTILLQTPGALLRAETA